MVLGTVPCLAFSSRLATIVNVVACGRWLVATGRLTFGAWMPPDGWPAAGPQRRTQCLLRLARGAQPLALHLDQARTLRRFGPRNGLRDPARRGGVRLGPPWAV